MKISSGRLKNRVLKTPKGGKTRPTLAKVRESVFNQLKAYIEGAEFLDLFAGSGSMGIEALSQGAEKVIFVEKGREAARCIRENLKNLELEGRVLQWDALRSVKKLIDEKETFTIIYADPPYDLDVSLLLPFLEKLLRPDGILFVEQGKKATLTISSLDQVSCRSYGDTQLFVFKKRDAN